MSQISALNFKKIFVAVFLLLTFSCSNSDQAFNFLESINNQVADEAECAFTDASPSQEAIRAPSASTGETQFTVSVSSKSCTVKYYLNGIAVDSLSGINVSLSSVLLHTGENLFEARVQGTKVSATGVTKKSWRVTKNNAPSCVNQLPAAATHTIGVGGRFDAQVNGADADNDSLTYTWKLNGGATPTSGFGSQVVSGTASAYFIPVVSQVGSQTLTVDISDGYDKATCTWPITVNNSCSLASYSPAGLGDVRVSAAPTTQTQFVAIPNNVSCVITWSLNGSPLPGNSNVTNILSSSLNTGSNILRVSVSDGITTSSRDWTVKKNSAPVCSSQTPASSGVSTSLGATLLMQANGTDADGDPITFSWTLNGSAAPPGIFTTFSTAISSLNTFAPVSPAVSTGVASISASMNDGYDTSQCSWNINVTNSCTIVSTSPSSSSFRVPNNPLSANSFTVTASDSGCPISWTLNGASLSGTESTKVINSSSLTTGVNILTAQTTNGTKTWFVQKNIPASCGTQTPTTSGSVVGVALTGNYSITPSDTESDPFTFQWKLNGVNAPAQVSVTSNATGSTAAFTPVSGQIGSNVLGVEINDGYDTSTCNWNLNVIPQCGVASASPGGATAKVAQLGTTNTQFTVVPNDNSCAVSWSLNGGASISTLNYVNILSSSLNSGPNTLISTLTNSVSSIQRTWVVTKNVAPSCATQTPSATGTTLGIGQSVFLNTTAGNSDSDTLSFNWTLNGQTVAGAILSVINSLPNDSQGQFIPQVSHIGANTIVSQINDGYDTSQCQWSVTVKPACSISSSIPSAATTRVSINPTAQATFGVVPNDSSCLVSWTLNGSPIGSASEFLTITSSSLNPGTNTIEATASNGVSTATRTWTVNQNRLPLCASQTPVATGNTMDIGQFRDLSAVISDPDSDNLTYTWKFNSSNISSLFTNITGSNTATAARFTPTVTQVGTGHVISSEISDSYDTAQCNWNFNINDPNTVSIQACLPSGNPVKVLSAGVNSIKDFSVSAQGTGLSYTWKLDGVTVSGASAPNIQYAAGDLSVGMHTLVAEVRDTYNNVASCTYNVKRNAPPALTSPTPNQSGIFRINYASTQAMSITATDGNSDALTYTWKIDGAINNTNLPTGASTSTFQPNSNDALLGARSVVVEVSDGDEVTTQTWNMEVNTFSSQCNTMMNSPVSGAGGAGGNVCTLVGYPGVGHQMNPVTGDQFKIRVKPYKIIEDDLNNIIFTDLISHAVWYYNRTGSPVTRFGQTIQAGQMNAILGGGANGENSQISPTGLQYKLSNPLGIAFDSESGRLYISEENNHRVIYITTSSNTPVKVLGDQTARNDSARNVQGAQGITHSCAWPAEVLLRGSGATRKLYVACRWQNAIKYMNADTGSGSYGQTYNLVGRMDASGVIRTSKSDGPIGSSSTSWGSSVAPKAMAFDPDGNLWVTENDANYNDDDAAGGWSMRIRVINMGGTSKTYFNGLKSPSQNQLFEVFDRNTSGAWAKNQQWSQSHSGVNPTSYVVHGPTAIRNSLCQPYQIISRNSSNAASAVTSAHALTLSANNGGVLYSDSSCSSSTTTATIPINSATTTVYFKNTSNATSTFSVSGSFGVAGVNIATSAPASGNALLMTIPTSNYYLDCTLVNIRAMNGSSPATTSVDRTLNLTTGGTGQFYTDSSCSSTPVVSATLTNGTGEVNLYYARTAIVPAGYIQTVLGNYRLDTNYSGISNYRNPTTGIPDWGMFRPWIPRGIEIDYSVGAVQGIYVTNWDQHRLIYINNTNSTKSFGAGFSVEPGDPFDVVGYYGGGFVDTTSGPNARFNVMSALSYSNDRTKLYIGDYNNGRVRQLDVGSNLFASTVLGSGYLRNGFANDAATAATEVRLNRPWRMAIDNTNRKVYFGDRSVCRLRQVDLLTGMVETAASRGCGDVTVQDTAVNTLARNIYGIALTQSGGANWVLWADHQDTTTDTINSTSMIRAFNTSLTNKTLFTIPVNATSVNTIAGNFNLGTGTWTGNAQNFDGATATNLRLNNPHGIAMLPNGDMLVSNYNDHCIIKLAANGTISRVIGACDRAVPWPTVDGPVKDGSNNWIASTRYPMQIVVDPVFAADGNFFFVDAPDTSGSKIKYVNYRNTSVTIGDTTVAAAVSPTNPTVLTIYSGIFGATGLAIFDNQICYSAGSWWADANWGYHNVTCRDRYSAVAAVTIRVGPPDSSPTRGGGPFGLEQENVASTNALLNGPSDIQFDSTGNLYIVDGDNHIIRLVRRWW